MAKKKILIIDDDIDICQLLQRFLERKGYSATTAFKANEGLDVLSRRSFDLVLTDFRLPDMDGLDLISEIKKAKPDIPVIVITGYSDVKQAVKVIQLGASEYVTKPIFPEEILVHIKNALTEKTEVKHKNDESKPVKKINNKQKAYLFGNSPKSQQIQRQIELVAPTDLTVLILGESGTGKEVAARILHNSSKRKEFPFVAVDCGALPKELAASELFGHVKGAFTGALNDKKGHFEMANGGTLFLDEIGNLSYENQIKLLRVLQEREVRRVGADKDIPVDVRIVVATNDDLLKSMEQGDFREDVYYRINEFQIQLPALRENTESIDEFLQFFLEQSNIEMDKSISNVDDEVIHAFKQYEWPGNIRELKNIIKRAVLLTNEDTIQIDVIPSQISNAVYKAPEVDSLNEEEQFDLKKVVEHAESKAILKALEYSKNNKSKTAELLGIDRKTLYNKMNAYGIKL